MGNTAKAKDTAPLDDLDLDFGDLSKFVDEDEASSGHQLGNLSVTEDDDDLIGDLSLLDEAIAELDSKHEPSTTKPVANTKPESKLELALETEEQALSNFQDALASKPASKPVPMPANAPASRIEASDDIPTLTDSIAEIARTGDTDLVNFDSPEAVPLLGESSIVGEAGSQFDGPTAKSQVAATSVMEQVPDAALSQLGDIAEELLASGETQKEPSLSLIDEPGMETKSTTELSPNDSIFENSLFESTPAEEESPEVDAQADEEPFSFSQAVASENITADDSIFNNSLFEDAPAEEDAAKSSYEEQVSSFTASMKERQAARGGFTSELHAQLSKKIDALVLDAIESLSDELHQQLASRMEALLMSSVDSALPPLVESFSASLRKEVQAKVHKKMPQIVNDLLGNIEFK